VARRRHCAGRLPGPREGQVDRGLTAGVRFRQAGLQWVPEAGQRERPEGAKAPKSLDPPARDDALWTSWSCG
jgi:hypothetical protein